ncbi:MAG: hypothetical protein SGPRY_012364, partial [Prymnesium sp.]
MLFEEHGFEGNIHNYYDYGNSLLDRVLSSRSGNPMTLAVLFSSICRRVGVELDLVGLPGHLLLATRPKEGEDRLFIDSYHGGLILGLDQCMQRVSSLRITWSDEMALPLSPCDVWDRMVRNLINCHERASDMSRLMVVALLPPEERARRARPECRGGPASKSSTKSVTQSVTTAHPAACSAAQQEIQEVTVCQTEPVLCQTEPAAGSVVVPAPLCQAKTEITTTPAASTTSQPLAPSARRPMRPSMTPSVRALGWRGLPIAQDVLIEVVPAVLNLIKASFTQTNGVFTVTCRHETCCSELPLAPFPRSPVSSNVSAESASRLHGKEAQ